jgi:hypothetical protein
MSETKRPVCAWTEDADGDWETTCGQMFILLEGKPTDNDMKFCCYCGGELAQVDYTDNEDDAARTVEG